MDWIKVAGALAVAALGGLGVVTLVTGWVAPWGRSRVLRPKLWGLGSVISAAGMGVFMFTGPFHGLPDPALYPYAITGWLVFFVGLAFQWRAQRPGRGRELQP